VIGFSQSHAGVLGVSGAAPSSPSDLPPNFLAGVVGLSDQQVGVIGRSNKLAGVYGFSQNADGVVGEIPPTSAFYAGKFFGRVLVNGDLTVAGGLKSCAVPFPDGTHRVLYCMESPEVWFEDFGAAKLKKDARS
jgi:hypothetical protein